MKNNKTDFFTSDSFPSKLWHLVNEPHITSISWDTSGEGVLIYEKPFEDEVLMSHSRLLRNYFKSSNFISFIRQMNLYGFKKVKTREQFSKDQPRHFHNPNFKRDKPELLLKLKRLTVSNKAKIAAGIEVPSLFSRRVHHGVLNSCQENSAAMITGCQSNPLKAQTLTTNPSPAMKNNKTDFFTSDSFPSKLWILVNEPHITSISWDPSGEGVLIYEKPFEDEVLMSHSRLMRSYFKTSNFTSFIRQLNLYGFKKFKKRGQFSKDHPRHLHNPYFKRDKPELLLKLKRLTVRNKAKIVAGIEVPSLSSRCVHHGMMNSCQENSTARITGHQSNQLKAQTLTTNPLPVMKNNKTDFFTSDSFPSKLWHLVNEPHITSISWDPSGEGVLIYEKLFEDEVLMSHSRLLRNYFKSSSFISFIRQLNLYGFKKVKKREQFSKDEPRHFHNPNFKRDKPELLLKIKRLTVSNKAKIAAGIEVPSLFSRRVHHGMLNSCQENSAAMITGSEMVQPHENGPQQYDQMANSSHKVVLSHSQPSSQAVYGNQAVPLTGFHHFPVDTHPSTPVQQAIIPHDSQDRFYSPGHQCNPGIMDSTVPIPEQPSPSKCGYDPDYSFRYVQPEIPDRITGGDLEPEQTNLEMDLTFKLVEESEAAADIRKEVTSRLENNPE